MEDHTLIHSAWEGSIAGVGSSYLETDKTSNDAARTGRVAVFKLVERRPTTSV